jgi:excisionase family DNA binding protein
MFTEDYMRQFANQIADNVLTKLNRIIKPSVAQRYLTVQQAADYIGHSKSSFEYLMTKNLFPIIREDRLVLIDREDLDKFMLRHKT